MKFSRTERFLLGISIWGILALLLLPFVDFSDIKAPDANGFALVIPDGSDIRSKHMGEYDWNALQKAKTLAEESRVFTGRGSKARIRFNDGAELELQPQTLIVLSEGAAAGRVIELQKGLVFLDLKGKEVLVRVGNRLERVSGDGARVRLEVSSNGAPKITLIKGRVAVGSGDKAVKLSDTGASVAMDSAKMVATVPKIKILSPADREEVWTTEGAAKIAFTWVGTKGQGDVFRLKTADGKPIQQETARNGRVDAKSLVPGEYTWEVVDPTDGATAKALLRIYPLEAPTITGVRSEDGTMRIAWDDPAGSQYWQVNVNEEQGGKTVFTASTYNKSLQTPILPRGGYQIRVTSFHTRRPEQSLASRVMTHWHDNRFSPAPVRVSLTEKSNNTELVWPGARQFTPGFEHVEKPIVRWSATSPTASALVQIAEDFGFEKIVSEFESNSGEGQWQNPQYGKWYVRVRPQGPFTQDTPWTEPGLMRVIYSAPVVTGLAKAADSPGVNVVWDSHPDNATFEVMAADNDKFEPAGSKRVKGRALQIPTGRNGQLFVKVRAVAANGWPISRWSDPAMYRPEPVIPPPLKPVLAKKEDEPLKRRKIVDWASGYGLPSLGAALAEHFAKSTGAFFRKAARLWVGAGFNYFRMGQSGSEVFQDATFANFGGPTVMMEFSMVVKKIWNLIFDFHDQPGRIQNDTYGLNVANSRWQTLSFDVTRPVGVTEFMKTPLQVGWRVGLQRHQFPFVHALTNRTVALATNNFTALGVGVEVDAQLSQNWAMENFLRYQIPVASGTSDGTVRYNSQLSFDGSLGLVRKVTGPLRMGFYWFGQMHNLKYNYTDSAGTASSGGQTFFNSNLQMRLGWEFQQKNSGK